MKYIQSSFLCLMLINFHNCPIFFTSTLQTVTGVGGGGVHVSYLSPTEDRLSLSFNLCPQVNENRCSPSLPQNWFLIWLKIQTGKMPQLDKCLRFSLIGRWIWFETCCDWLLCRFLLTPRPAICLTGSSLQEYDPLSGQSICQTHLLRSGNTPGPPQVSVPVSRCLYQSVPGVSSLFFRCLYPRI